MSTNTWSIGRSIVFTALALAAVLIVDQLVGCMSAPAQQRERVPGVASTGQVVSTPQSEMPATADELIRQMSLSASIIFAGEVMQVRRPVGFAGSPDDAAEGIVEIDFRVDQAVLGVPRNSIYTLREWSGLWTGGTDRYRAGQRLLMLLRAPNAAGLTSPVHGSEGAIPLRGVGAAPGPYDSGSTAAQWMVDIRWLQAQTLNQQLRTPAPLYGPIPIRGKGRLHSEALGSAHDPEEAPLLVPAIPEPWIERNDSAPQAEPLAHILDICTEQMGPNDAQR